MLVHDLAAMLFDQELELLELFSVLWHVKHERNLANDGHVPTESLRLEDRLAEQEGVLVRKFLFVGVAVPKLLVFERGIVTSSTVRFLQSLDFAVLSELLVGILIEFRAILV